ncbi:MAG TPA: hypothetical protein V6C99_10950, partial [Oculatellaceae cyanobacterium]
EELPTPTKEEADELATESVELATDAPPLTVPDEEVETDEIEEVEVAVAVKPRRGRLKKQEEAPPDVVEIFQPDEEEEPVEAVPEFLADTMEESAEAPEEAEEAGDAQESTVVSAVTPPKRRGGRPQKRTVKKSAAKR